MNILVISPHGDDEVLGCGGTIKKMSDLGHHVYRCIVTSPFPPHWSSKFIKQREKEIEQSGKILEIKKTYKLNFPSIQLDTIPQHKINDALFQIIEESKPTTVFTSSNCDLNRDHRIVFESSLVAARPKPGSSVRKLLTYEIVSETEWGWQSFKPNYYEDISKTIKTKIKAMNAYKSELRSLPHPRHTSILKTLATIRGSEVGLSFCEAFQVIRLVY